MRKLLLAFTAATLLATGANAQLGVQKVTKKILPTVTFGLKAGANVQRLNGTDTWKSSFKPGIVAGAFLSVDKKKKGIRVEGLVKTARFDMQVSPWGYVNTVALDVPVLFEFKPIPRIWLQVGPQFTSMLSARHSSGVDAKNSFTGSDLSAVGGLEVTLPFKLTFGARYIIGLIDVNNSATAALAGAGHSWKNSSMQFSVGYRFFN